MGYNISEAISVKKLIQQRIQTCWEIAVFVLVDNGGNLKITYFKNVFGKKGEKIIFSVKEMLASV